MAQEKPADRNSGDGLAARRLLSPAGAVGVGSLVTAGAAVWLWSISHQATSALSAIPPGVAFTGMLMLGSGRVIETLRRLLHSRPLRIAAAPLALWLIYLSYAFTMGIGDGTGALTMAVYLGVPFALLSVHRGRPGTDWLEPIAILWLWLPLESGLIRRLLVTGRSVDPHYALAQLLAIDAGVLAFAVWKETPGIGFRFEWDREIVRSGIVAFLKFAPLAIPLGFAIHFIGLVFHPLKLVPAPAIFVGVFFFTAFPEEFLFRGLIQNWIERATGRPAASLIAAALIFGASHLNNGRPIPNYRYFLMASIAGLFYGAVWQKTRTLAASATTHALVDTVWTTFFR